MFWHVFKTKLKVLLRSKTTLFWALAFPFIMSILFNAAFGSFNKIRETEPSKVAIAEESLAEDSEWRMFFTELDKHESFEISFMSLDEAKQKLENG